MPRKYRFGSKQRDATWSDACFASYIAGETDGTIPACNLCHKPVKPTDAWDRSHVGAPKALGGISVGVGHRACNREDNRKNVTPRVAKMKRVRAKALGLKGPGLGRYPMPCGRRSNFTKQIGGRVARRTGLREKTALMRFRRQVGEQRPIEEFLPHE